jgi:hypothetical protein
MTPLFSNPVALKSGLNTSAGMQIADSVNQLVIEVVRWNGTSTCSLAVDFSFDGGVTWGWRSAVGAVTPSQLDAWKVKKPSFSGNLGLTIWCWKMCQCGEVYLPGAPLNGKTTNHSTYKSFTSAQIAAIGRPTDSLYDLDPGAFHIPDNQPATGLPLRQLRAVTTASANINTTLNVSSVP